MNSRERLLAALRHEAVDRIPVSTYELVGWDSDSWENSQPAYRDLMDLIRARTDCLYMAGCPAANPAARVTAAEWREGPHTYRREVLHTPLGDLTTASRQDDGINTVWVYEHLLKTDEDVARYLSQPIESGPADMTSLALAQARLEGGKGIALVSVADPICRVAQLFDFSDFVTRAFTQPQQIEALLDHVAPAAYAHLHDILDRGAGPLFRIVGAEYVTPPFLPPTLFDRFVVRYTTPMVDLIHEHGAYSRLHCHGRIRQVLSMIVGMNVDALDPVEGPPTGDIDLSEVKRLYGDRLCLMGNIQLRDLETAPPEEMRRMVRETVAAGAPGGGFVVMPTAAPIHAELSPVTERNYRIYIETALECGAAAYAG